MIKAPLTVTINIRTFQILLLESFRYCLGRRTYAVSDCVELLTEHWKLLPEGYQKQMHGDISHAIEHKMAGDDCDIVEWKKILELKIGS